MNIYAYDGRGSTYRTNNGSPNKSATYSFHGRRRNHTRAHHSHHSIQNQNNSDIHPQEPVRPPNADPEKLLQLLKTSGEYDRLRKQIFTTFQKSEMRKTLLSRVDGVVTECLAEDPSLLSQPPDQVHTHLLKELDTYPFVERQVLCVPIWRDDDWIAAIERTICNLIHDRPTDAPMSNGTPELVPLPAGLPPPPPGMPLPPPHLLKNPPPMAALLHPGQRPPSAALLPPNLRPPPTALLRPAPWRVKETAPRFIPEEDKGDKPLKPTEELGEDDMAIDDD